MSKLNLKKIKNRYEKVKIYIYKPAQDKELIRKLKLLDSTRINTQNISLIK
jgi:hypothetical protein